MQEQPPTRPMGYTQSAAAAPPVLQSSGVTESLFLRRAAQDKAKPSFQTTSVAATTTHSNR